MVNLLSMSSSWFSTSFTYCWSSNSTNSQLMIIIYQVIMQSFTNIFRNALSGCTHVLDRMDMESEPGEYYIVQAHFVHALYH